MPVRLRLIAVVSLLTFGLSLALPALEFHPSRKDDADYVWSGGQALILGWQAVFVVTEVVRLGAGFYVWLASMLAVIVGAHAFRRGSLQ